MSEEIYLLMSDVLKKPMDVLMESKDDTDAWDSLSRVEVLFAIEENYNIMFDEEELGVLTTPAALCNATEGKLEAK